MALTINVHEAKTHFSELLARVGVGEEVIIAKAGKPVARLVPISEKSRPRVPGTAAGPTRSYGGSATMIACRIAYVH
jgi:prevent-host-death family protein